MSYEDGQENSGGSFGDQIVARLPRFVMQVGGFAVAIFIGFTIYIAVLGGSWTFPAFMTVVMGGVAAVVYIFVRKMLGKPIRFSDTDDELFEAEFAPEPPRGMDISENMVLLRYVDEFNAALSDLDEFGACEFRQSFLKSHKVKQGDLIEIIETIIFDDFGKEVVIRVKRTPNMKYLKFYDPDWRAAGHYSGRTYGPSDDSDEDTATESE